MAWGDKPYLTAQSCYVTLINEADEWLFVHRAQTGYQDNRWGLPGGHVKPGEPIDLAAVREAEEEVGVRIKLADLTLTHVLQRNKANEEIEDRMDFYFAARTWEGTPHNKEPHVHDAVAWFKPDAVPGEMVDFIQIATSAILKGDRFSTLGWSVPDEPQVE